MNCIHCGSSNTDVFFKEDIPCCHCEGAITVVYEACGDCNLMWKSVDGEVISNSADTLDELNDVLLYELDKGPVISDEEAMVAMDDFLNFLKEEADDSPIVDSMQDLLHKCLRCESISYEVRPRHYLCPECGFEWEVLQ